MKKQILNSLIASSSLLLVSFLYQKTTILFIILLILSGILLTMNYSKSIIKLYFYGFFFGALSEAFAVYMGAWVYTKTDTFLHVPLWLFPLWGIASVFITQTHLYFQKKSE